jgi:predicted RNA-binding Zn-ribbon protein involved in translation (DUF1610 family)
VTKTLWTRGRIRIGLLIVGAAAAVSCLLAVALGGDAFLLLFVCFFTIALLACGSLLYAGKSRWWAGTGMIAAGCGVLCGPAMTNDWSLGWFDEFEYVFAYCFFATTFLCYAAFVVALPLRGRWLRRVRWSAVAIGGFFVVTLTHKSIHEQSWNVPSPMVNIAGGLTVALGLFLPLLALWTNRWHVDTLQSTAGRVELSCPRCGERQELGLGRDRCRKCRLVITIDVREPRCPGCGFLLYRVPGGRCPECGRTIPPDDVWRGRGVDYDARRPGERTGPTCSE